MDNNNKVIGVLELEPHQANLISKFAETILMGSYENAVETFEVIFEREPENELEMMIFNGLCQQELKKQQGTDFGIKGVFDGGKRRH